MVVNEFTGAGSKKTSAGGNWSLGHKPTSSEQAVIPAAKEAEVNLELECGAFKCRGKLIGAQQIKAGGSEAGPESKLIDYAPEAGTTWSGKFEIVATAEAAQTVALGSYVNELRVTAASNVKLAESPTLTSRWLQELGKLDLNEKTLSGQFVEIREGVTELKAAHGKIKATGAGGVSSVLQVAAKSVVGAETAVLEWAGTGTEEHKLQPGLAKWEKFVFNCQNCLIETEGDGANEWTVNNKGAAAGKGLRLKEGVVFEAVTVTTNGTEAEPARIESTVSGKSATLAIGEQELLSWVKLKDIKVPTGVWYLPKGTDEGGNVTVGTTVKFEAKPGGGAVVGKATGTLLLTGTANGIARNVVSGKASGPLLLTGTSAGTVRSVVTGKATGTLLLTGTAKGVTAGAVAGHATGAILLTGTSKATLAAVVKGKATGSILLTGTATGQRISKIAAKATGTILFAGAAKGSVSGNVVGKASGALLFGGSAHSSSAVSPALVRFTNWKAASVRTANWKAASVRVRSGKVASVRTTNL